MAEYIPNWKGLEAYSFTGSNQDEITAQAQKNGGSTFTDDKGNFYVVIDKTEYFLPPNYVLVINEKRAGKLYKKADFDAKYKDYSGGGSSGTEITAGEGIKVSATGEVSVDFDVLAKKEDLNKNVFVAVYNQTTAQELLDYLATTNKPYAPIVVERGGQYYTAILSYKQNDETAYIRILGSASGEYTVFNHSIKGKVWGTETTVLQKKIDLSTYYTKTETDAKIAAGIAGFDKLDYKIVDTLPATGDAGVRYLVKIPKKKSFEEWIYITDEWHNIGTTSDVNLDNYYTKTETEAWVNAQNFLKEHQDLSGYATEAWVNEQSFAKSIDLTLYATEAWVNTQRFVKTDDLERGYYDRFETENSIDKKTLYLGSNTAFLEPPTDIHIRNNNSTASVSFSEITEGLEVRAKYDGKDLSFNNIQLVSKNYLREAIALGTMAFAYKDDVDADIDNLILTKQNNLTAGEGIKIENDVISSTSTFDPNDHFKLLAVSEDNITIASGGRVNKQLQIQNLPAGFQIVAYKQVSIEKASQETNAEAFHKVYIQTFSTAGGGTKANISVVNTNTFSTQIKLAITCLAMKIG